MLWHNSTRNSGHSWEQHQSERGAVVAETAIVFPVLFLVLAGIIQIAMIFSANVNVRNASAAGARAGVLEDATDAEVINIAKKALVSPLDGEQLQVTPVPVTIDGINYLEVRVTYPLSIWFTKLIPGLGTTMNINATTRMK